MLISLEGTDAAGKATQVARIAERVGNAGRSAVVYSFPRYDTVLGAAIKRHLMLETVLIEKPRASIDLPVPPGKSIDFTLPRAPEDALMFQCLMLVDKMAAGAEIRGHLVNDRVVICDRWTASAVAYGGADGLDRAWLQQAQAILPQAHLNIFLDVPEEEALRRRPNLRDRYEKDREKQKLVRENYTALNLTRVDGVGSVAEVTDRIWACVIKHPEWE